MDKISGMSNFITVISAVVRNLMKFSVSLLRFLFRI
jgi:hypothetical protein